MSITEILKKVFALKNVRRAPGDAGKLKGFTEVIHETETEFYIQRNGTVGPWPGSMYIVVCTYSPRCFGSSQMSALANTLVAV